jgi:hypothetical protein
MDLRVIEGNVLEPSDARVKPSEGSGFAAVAGLFLSPRTARPNSQRWLFPRRSTIRLGGAGRGDPVFGPDVFGRHAARRSGVSHRAEAPVAGASSRSVRSPSCVRLQIAGEWLRLIRRSASRYEPGTLQGGRMPAGCYGEGGDTSPDAGDDKVVARMMTRRTQQPSEWAAAGNDRDGVVETTQGEGWCRRLLTFQRIPLSSRLAS